MQGEHLGIYKPDCLNNVNWVSTSKPPKHQPLTWYKAVVDQPSGNEPVALDMLKMGKGQAWLNGEAIRRFWTKKSYNNDNCSQECDYKGTLNQQKCLTGCGEPSQRWYHIPRSWFKPSGNILVIFEETGGDPTKIRFSRHKISGTCAVVAEDHRMVEQDLQHEDGNENNKTKASLQLNCPNSTRISTVKFASFGTPRGACGSYRISDCHDPNSTSVVEKACLNEKECAVELTETDFDYNLCTGATKKLAVEVICS